MATEDNFNKNYFLLSKCHLDIISLILEKKITVEKLCGKYPHV